MAILRLIRLPNVLMIILTQSLVWWCLVHPILGLMAVKPALTNTEFLMLMASTVLVAIGGYVINDIYDLDVDRINKPEKVVIGKQVSEDAAWWIYGITTVAGVGLGFYLTYKMDRFNLGTIHALAAGALYFYSYSYKRQMLIGNLIIAVLAALVPFLPGFYELQHEEDSFTRTYLPMIYILGYTFFAFITTLIREIIKDIEDKDGDVQFNCRTFPIVAGEQTAKYTAVLLSLVTMAVAAYVQYFQWNSNDFISFGYFTIGVQLPLAVLIWQLYKAQQISDYRKASLTNKLVMLGGILSMLVFYLTLK